MSATPALMGPTRSACESAWSSECVPARMSELRAVRRPVRARPAGHSARRRRVRSDRVAVLLTPLGCVLIGLVCWGVSHLVRDGGRQGVELGLGNAVGLPVLQAPVDMEDEGPRGVSLTFRPGLKERAGRLPVSPAGFLLPETDGERAGYVDPRN